MHVPRKIGVMQQNILLICIESPFTLPYTYMSHHESWYSERTLAAYMHIWGYHVLVPNHDMKKSNNRAALGQFYRYAKTRALLRWIYPLTDAVKHARAARFLEIDHTSPVITPGQQTASPKHIDIPLIFIDVSDRVHFETEPLVI
jgi:hypothetical protein